MMPFTVINSAFQSSWGQSWGAAPWRGAEGTGTPSAEVPEQGEASPVSKHPSKADGEEAKA